jgi:hypothetical protein
MIGLEGHPMKAHAALRVDAIPARRLPFPSCPNCDTLLFAATASAHVSEHNVRHAWVCDDCGHAFVTTVQLAPADARQSKPIYS